MEYRKLPHGGEEISILGSDIYQAVRMGEIAAYFGI